MARPSEHPHLPPGHEPGPQSRRARFGRVASGCLIPVLLAFGLLFLVVFGGIGLLVVTSGGGTIGAPFLAAGVLAFLLTWGIAILLWRRARPGRDRDLVPAVERTEVRRGDAVRVGLPLGAGGGDVELGLVCRVRYDVWVSGGDSSSSSRQTRIAVCRETWAEASGAGVALTVPPDAPGSYEGTAVSFAWSVAARRRGRRRTSEPVAIWVAP